MRSLLSRTLHLLKWVPPLWLIVMMWLTWGDMQMLRVGSPLPVLTEVPSSLQHLDAAVVVVLFVGALVYRLLYRPRMATPQVVWAGLATLFMVIGGFSSVINHSIPFDAAGSMLSLGRNALYFSALSLLSWADRDRERVFKGALGLVALNVAAVGVQWLLWIRLTGPSLPEDFAVGIFGFANDAALLNLTAFVGVLLSTLPKLRRAAVAAVLFVAGVASSFLTGTGVTLGLVPFVWMLARGGDPLKLLVRAVAGYVVAIAALYMVIQMLMALMGPMMESYAAQLSANPPGFVTGVPLITSRVATTSVRLAVGLGPGRVNSRGAIKSGTVMPELTLPVPTGMSPLTYFQMNQSALVALAEFGWLGFATLTLFWGFVVWRVREVVAAEWVDDLHDAFKLTCLTGVVVLFFLGFVSLGWNETPFGYVVLLAAGSLVAR